MHKSRNTSLHYPHPPFNRSFKQVFVKQLRGYVSGAVYNQNCRSSSEDQNNIRRKSAEIWSMVDIIVL